MKMTVSMATGAPRANRSIGAILMDSGALTPEVGVPFVNRLDAEADRVWRADKDKRVEPRRGMHQRVNIVADLREQAHLKTRPTDALPTPADRRRGRLNER